MGLDNISGALAPEVFELSTVGSRLRNGFYARPLVIPSSYLRKAKPLQVLILRPDCNCRHRSGVPGAAVVRLRSSAAIGVRIGWPAKALAPLCPVAPRRPSDRARTPARHLGQHSSVEESTMMFSIRLCSFGLVSSPSWVVASASAEP